MSKTGGQVITEQSRRGEGGGRKRVPLIKFILSRSPYPWCSKHADVPPGPDLYIDWACLV